jgi:arabinan endo-1,5-alpha-L-arabinosidase
MRTHVPSSAMPTRRSVIGIGIAAVAGTILRPRFAYADDVPINNQMTGDISPTHDPCIMKQGDTYYVFGTSMPGSPGITLRTSKDLVHWTARTPLFSAIPEWAATAIPGTKGMWAPDISLFNGKYYLYYAYSSFGSNRSAIGLSTAATLDPDSPQYGWTDQGLVLMSRDGDDFNAIDPNRFVDLNGRHWLIYGSFWTGIKMRRIDPNSGKPLDGDAKVYALAKRPEPSGGPDPIEAPFMIERKGYYYLFASYDYCCKGVQSTYYTAVGRSKEVTGPFVGRSGESMLQGSGTVILRADLKEQNRWRGPGHCAILNDDGKYYIVYHAYDSWNRGAPTLRIDPITWTDDGWPIVNS